MKIAILTLPLYTNYGGILQAYALQTILERMGHDVYVIAKKRKLLSLPIQKMPFVYGKRIIKNLIGRRFPLFYEQKVNREGPIIRQYTDEFIHKYIHLKQYDTFSDIQPSEYDAFVVGSDQVWRPKYFGIKQIENAYLKFTEGWNIKRLAYAASFGTDNWEYTPRQTEECSRLVKLFNAISVREDSGVGLCKRYLGVDAQHVLDPTMLLNEDDYVSLLKKQNTPPSKGTLLSYILDETPEKEILINNLSERKSLKPFRVNSKVENPHAPLSERIQPPVEQWLRGFYDAKFVITDSFHACVFSILFRKQFIVYGNEERGMARFKSLLTTLGLENRMVTTTNDLDNLEEIDYNEVYVKLSKLRKQSLLFISKINL
ncbi:polysaccharide pyruvyl transferase family protein [uncultured Mediterranea sp.]|uniref:polysaccharide pyruvyl transferase family protein n=1 Tax=uncultured Mediterranea sp. TaxID=1926662 RepID=UPI00280602B3|nr:polysaccharide pyruvyl transferase family protein [uncultured Mediterranea sp.]